MATGTIPVVDLFTYTQAGQFWHNQAWLMQCFLYLMYWLGNLPLVIFAHATMIIIGYTVALRAVAQGTSLRAAVAAAIIAIGVALSNWNVRPQRFSFLAFGLLIFLIESHRQGQKQWQKRCLWWTIPLFAAWVNSHGMFVFGLAALGIYMAVNLVENLWDSWQQGTFHDNRQGILELSLIGIGLLAALCLNPQGPLQVITYVTGFLEHDATRTINKEFAPITIRTTVGFSFYVSLLVISISLYMSRFRPSTDQVLTLVLFVLLTLFAERSVAWYGFIAMPILAASLSQWLLPVQQLARATSRASKLILSVFILASILYLPWWRLYSPTLREQFPLLHAETPVASAEYLCNTIPADTKGFQNQQFASYLVSACPELPLFLDTRFELYPVEQWQDYLAISNGQYDWESRLHKYKATYLFLEITTQKDVAAAASISPNWHEIYQDQQAIIFQIE